MACLCLTLCAARPSPAAGRGEVLSGIELRYNQLATLRVDFEQSLQYLERQPKTERGTLYLYRPGKMRWDYSEPAGKVFVGDGETLHMYNPFTRQVTRRAMDESGDLRAPLAFLLGRLDFSRQFRNLRLDQIDGRSAVLAGGRQNDAYERVEFFYEPADYRLTEIRVFGRDESVTVFRFAREERNPRLDPARFDFEPPAGAEIVDDAHGAGER